jgi:hypothetical protein
MALEPITKPDQKAKGRAASLAWYHQNKQAINLKRNAFNKAHPEKVREAKTKWRHRYPQKAKEVQNNWRRNNSERARATDRARYKRDREKRLAASAIWRKANRARRAKNNFALDGSSPKITIHALSLVRNKGQREGRSLRSCGGPCERRKAHHFKSLRLMP